MHDLKPFISGLVVGVVPPVVLPGPSKSEWSGAVFTVLALAVREVVYWFRHRKK